MLFQKSRIFILYIILIGSFKALGNDFSYIINPSIGFAFDRTNELVYSNSIKESELIWTNFYPVLIFENNFSYRNFLLDFVLTSAIPVELGNMQDFDYFLDNSGKISAFSDHNSILSKNYSFLFCIGYCFKIQNYSLSPFVSAGYQNIKFESDDGYLQYPVDGKSWTGNEDKEYLNGTAISYEQQIYSLSIGFKARFLIKKINLCLTSLYSPFIYSNAIDNHFLRLTQFCDTFSNGFAFNTTLDIYCPLIKHRLIKLSIKYKYFNANGDSRVNDIGIVTSSTELQDNCIVQSIKNEILFNLGIALKI